MLRAHVSFVQPIDKYPQKLAGESGNDGVPEMIVVGGIEVYDNNIGKLYERSQTADYVSVYAPSFKINCANANGGLRIREEVAGTSHGKLRVQSSSICDFRGVSKANTSQRPHKWLGWPLTSLASLITKIICTTTTADRG